MFWEKYQHDQYLLDYEILELKKKKKKIPHGIHHVLIETLLW